MGNTGLPRLFSVALSALFALLAFLAPVGAKAAAPAPCETWSRALPNVARALCDAAALRDSGARSVRGTPLLVRDIAAPEPAPASAALAATSLPQPQPPPLRVLVVGGIHGDELSSASLALHWIALVQQRPAPLMPRPLQWRFIPLLNPDGLLHQPPRRVNARGVDLNRNFPTPNWERDAPVYWQQRTKKDPRRYPGPSPLSEPESRFLHTQMQQYAPDLIVSIHAPYGVLDFDGPSVPPSRLGRLYLDQVGVFPGSLGHYGGVHKGVPVVTIELPNAQRTPLDAEMRQMWLDLLRWTGERLGGAAGGAQAR